MPSVSVTPPGQMLHKSFIEPLLDLLQSWMRQEALCFCHHAVSRGAELHNALNYHSTKSSKKNKLTNVMGTARICLQKLLQADNDARTGKLLSRILSNVN